ncbi:uncharacterized protein EAE97_009906 [Botrytis byssoidea]|uniref:Uncharacterized protein n=1 Tax=Botrytis byssoidea TaxID=139641 RepID=A0A9P5I2J3_9HELO|nr:uncharacterized protein EAE97_009906 [Botrytis byssoidea]KAF7928108.1 hypothetical protein EAE97_009906 [Botrytis byssoidea]
MSYSWYNATAIARRTSRATGENNSSILHTILISLGALIVFGILDNITLFWSALGLQSSPVYFEPLETREYIIIGDDQEAADETTLPLMTPASPRRTTRGRVAKDAQNEDSLMTPTTLRRSNRVKEREAKSAFPTPTPTPTAPMRSVKAKGKGKTNSIKEQSFDDFYEPLPTPTAQKKVIKGREKQIVLDEYEAFMNEPEEKKSKKSSEDAFDYDEYSTPWTATQRKNVSKGKLGKTPKGKGQKGKG